MGLNIMGIWASSNGSSCCLLQDGVVQCSAQEKDFSEDKGEQLIPVKAFKFCLSSADISITDIDCITFCEESEKALESQSLNKLDGKKDKDCSKFVPRLTAEKIKSFFGYTGTVVSVKHQSAHAALSYYSSGFNEAAIMVIDKAGPWTLTYYGYGKDKTIEILDDLDISAISMMSSLIARYLGFKKSNEEYKVKLMAEGGRPLYSEKIKKLMIHMDEESLHIYSSSIEIDKIFEKYYERLVDVLKASPRNPTESVTKFHRDIASSMELVFQEFMIDRAKHIYKRTNMKNLCISENLALNSMTNIDISKELPFEKIFVPRTCDDSACAIGAAMEGYLEGTGRLGIVESIDNLLLGVEYSDEQIEHILCATDMEYGDYRGKEEEMLSFIEGELTKGKIVGWFQGRTGIGSGYPYTRLALADPRKLNLHKDFCSALKNNDGLIPIHYAVLDKEWKKSCASNAPCQAISENIEAFQIRGLSEITCSDVSERVFPVNRQRTPLLYELIQRFYSSTGCAVLANTPLKLEGDDNASSLYEAIKIFITSKIDLLVMGSFILEREKNAKPWVSWMRIQLMNL